MFSVECVCQSVLSTSMGHGWLAFDSERSYCFFLVSSLTYSSIHADRFDCFQFLFLFQTETYISQRHKSLLSNRIKDIICQLLPSENLSCIMYMIIF